MSIGYLYRLFLLRINRMLNPTAKSKMPMITKSKKDQLTSGVNFMAVSGMSRSNKSEKGEKANFLSIF